MSTSGNRNSAKKVQDHTTPPWVHWTGSKAGLITQFIQTYCIVPKGYGAGEPMRLAPFQLEGIEQLFSEGVRTGEFSMGRGNGKSSLIAAISLAHLCLEPHSPQVPLIATKLRQIEAATYNVVVAMAKRHPEVGNRLLTYGAVGNKKIMTPWNDGELFPISSDVEGLQGLDPSLALIDEVGFVSVEAWDALKMAGGKRPESLVLGLGTTGETDSALYHLHQLHDSGQVLPGHCRINYSAPEGCDHRDPAMWRLANPALAEGFLGEDAIAADAASSSEGQFRRYRLNQWVEVGDHSWLGDKADDVWQRLADPQYQWDDGAPTFAGVDVAMYHDSSAVIAVQQRPDGRWHARSQIFWPDGGVTPFDEIQNAIRRLPNLAACAYDNRFFAAPAQELLDEGILMVDIPQTPQRMVPAIGKLYRMIIDGTLTHDGAPDYASQVISAVPRHSEHGFTLSKSKSKKKIDAAVATALALSMVDSTEPMATPESFKIY